jgi:hypothetical protein
MNSTPSQPRRLIEAKELGRQLGCSAQHVHQLADRGAIPWGLKIGRLRFWDAGQINQFIAGGCRPVRIPRKDPRR